MPLDEWVSKYRVLGVTNPRPGKWSFDITPYLIEPHKDFSNKDVTTIVLKLASQMGKTEMFNNVTAYTIAEDPCPMLMIFSKGELAEYFSKVRFSNMVDAMPFLKEQLITKREKNKSTGEKLLKMFVGGFLIFASSNSPSNVASWPARRAIGDEVDRFMRDVKGEGSAIDLVQKRLSNFDDTKLLLGSTPTTVDKSKIEEMYGKSSSGMFHVPCPSCSNFILFKFENIKTKEDIAYHRCPSCNDLIPERERVSMIQKGKWIHKNPHIKDIKGYEISAMYSAFGTKNMSWVELKKEYDESLKDENKRKVFVNTRESRAYGFSSSDFVEWDDLLKTAEKKRFVPDPVILVTAAMDVQKDRIEYLLNFWGVRFESCVHGHGKITGDPTQKDIWINLFDRLLRPFKCKNKEYNIDIAGIDTGYLTDHVHVFIQAAKIRRAKNPKYPVVLGLKGTFSGETIIRYAPEREISKRKRKKTRAKYLVNVNLAKDVLFKAIKNSYLYKIGVSEDKPENYYYSWFDKSPAYYKQLASEEPTIVVRNGMPRTQYIARKGFIRNEILDLWVYNLALACYIFKGDTMDDNYWKLWIGSLGNRHL